MQSTTLRNILLLTTTLGCVSVAHAQESEDVVVTGSRIVRPGFTAPTPVSTLTVEELEARAPSVIAELQDDIPQFRPNQNTNLAGGAGQSNLDLRGLGPTRTLILVDGRRMPVTTATGNIDSNIIPPLLVSRIDLVTGGASAAYGSDAVSGVVNIILDKRLEGFKGLAQLGQSQVGDLMSYNFGGAYGTSFAEDRGRIVISGEVYKNLGAKWAGKRDWTHTRTNVIQNPTYVAGNTSGQTRLIYGPNSTQSRQTLGGQIVSVPNAAGVMTVLTPTSTSPFRGIQFGPNGERQPYAYGTNISGSWQTGGDGSNWSETVNVAAHVDRKSLYSSAEFDLTPNLTAWADVNYAKLYARQYVLPNYHSGDMTILRQNAFMPTWLGQLMDQNGITAFVMGKTNLDVNFATAGRVTSIDDVNVGRYAVGLRGTIGETWNWNAFAQYGQSDHDQILSQNEVTSRFNDGLNSRLVNGVPTCVSSITNPNNGCVAANPFGYGSWSQAFIDWAYQDSVMYITQAHKNVGVEISGEPFELWAGPVSIAAGAEYRRDWLAATSDLLSQQNAYRTFNPQPIRGTNSVKEVFGEVAVPLLNDSPLGDADFNAAVRRTDYSNSGLVTTWKAGLSYSPIEDIRFRGTVSRDIRAPNLSELYTTRTQGTSIIIDPFLNVQQNFRSIGGGNPNLKPEEADTKTYGVVVRPSFMPGLQVSVDYFDIEIAGAIGSVAAQQVVNNCFQGQTLFCPQITRDPVTNRITEVFASSVNFSQLNTSGVDVESVYSFDPGFIPGRMTLRGAAAYVKTLSTTASNVTVDRVRDINGVPQWRFNASALWSNDPISLQLSYRFVGRTLWDSTFIEGVDINENDVDSRQYLDGTASYQINEGLQAFFKVENIFDTDPPLTPSTSSSNQQWSSNLYQINGRMYSAGVRLRF